MNIFDVITRDAIKRADQLAIVDGERSLTHGQLRDSAQKTASHMRDLGIKPGDRIGLSLKDNLDHAVAMLASAAMGAAIVPVDWRARPAEKQRLSEAFQLTAVLVEPGSRVPDGVPCIPVDDTWHSSVAAATRLPTFRTDGSHTFILNLSSGTSGQPKGAVVTHDDYRQRSARYPLSYGSFEGQRYLSAMPLCFSAGRNHLLLTLTMGGTVFMYPPLFGPEEYVEATHRYGITKAFLVPTTVRWLLALPEQKSPLLPNLQIWGCGTAFLSADEKREAARRIAPNMVAGYSTSGTGSISSLPAVDFAERGDTVGRPFLMMKVEIVDQQDQPVPPDQTGRVRVQGPGVSRSYFGDPVNDSDEGVRGDWFYTGELGAMDESGYLSLRGRSSSLIVRGGANVYPEEVEQVILSHEAIAEAAVIGRPSPDLGEEVVAAVVTKHSVPTTELLSLCRKQLSNYKVPVEIRVVPGLPKTTSGKVKRREVMDQFSNARPMSPVQE